MRQGKQALRRHEALPMRQGKQALRRYEALPMGNWPSTLCRNQLRGVLQESGETVRYGALL